MLRVWSCTYPLQQSKDVAFEIGRVLMGLKDYGGAVRMFEASQAFCGEHHISWFVSPPRRRQLRCGGRSGVV